MKEQEHFDQIRKAYIKKHQSVEAGKMMHAEAIHYKGKVFAFFSKTHKMVFKLGKGFNPTPEKADISPFNPFKKKPPLAGWFEVSYDANAWEFYTERAFDLIRQEVE